MLFVYNYSKFILEFFLLNLEIHILLNLTLIYEVILNLIL
jgi:hypothetical protein